MTDHGWGGGEATAVEIQVGKGRTSRDDPDSRDSSPFDFAQGQNDGKDLAPLEQRVLEGEVPVVLGAL